MTDWSELTWRNEPLAEVRDDLLIVRTSPQTDFWRQTHYGFMRDSGHFLGLRAPPDFTVQVRLQGEYRTLYDQAGLMLRTDEWRWIKAGVEFVGRQQLSAVVTLERSDWSVVPTLLDPAFIDLRLTRREDAVSVQARQPGQRWQLLRLAPFPAELEAQVGVYAASPGTEGFEVTFSHFSLGGAREGPLY